MKVRSKRLIFDPMGWCYPIPLAIIIQFDDGSELRGEVHKLNKVNMVQFYITQPQESKNLEEYYDKLSQFSIELRKIAALADFLRAGDVDHSFKWYMGTNGVVFLEPIPIKSLPYLPHF